uniref:Avidin n=1 Tax=Accipiter nisus TaxID=211598 RepID=A0A8B9NAR9_9AVES
MIRTAHPALLLHLPPCTNPELPVLQCMLTGRWINELGSNMTIMARNGKGEFSGFYHTAVTATMNEIQVSPLQGSQHRTNQKSHPTFGFTVNWSFSGTSPFPAPLALWMGKEILRTMWMTQGEVDSLEDDWKASG